MQDRLEIREAMGIVRNRGLASADLLAERVEKLADWREHVRAHPWPIALAVAATGFWMVPARQAKPNSRSRLPAVESLKSHDNGVVRKPDESKAGIANLAMAFVGSMIGNAVRSYVSGQIQSLVNTRGNHAASEQRQVHVTRY